MRCASASAALGAPQRGGDAGVSAATARTSAVGAGSSAAAAATDDGIGAAGARAPRSRQLRRTTHGPRSVEEGLTELREAPQAGPAWLVRSTTRSARLQLTQACASACRASLHAACGVRTRAHAPQALLCAAVSAAAAHALTLVTQRDQRHGLRRPAAR